MKIQLAKPKFNRREFKLNSGATVKALATGILFASAARANAQQASVPSVPEERQKISVQMKIVPSVEGSAPVLLLLIPLRISSGYG